MEILNCVPTYELSDQHLKTDYHKIMFCLIRLSESYAVSGDRFVAAVKKECPNSYPEHMIQRLPFFNDKALYLVKRYRAIRHEMIANRKLPLKQLYVERYLPKLPENLRGDWEPDFNALFTNRAGLLKDYMGNPKKYKWTEFEPPLYINYYIQGWDADYQDSQTFGAS